MDNFLFTSIMIKNIEKIRKHLHVVYQHIFHLKIKPRKSKIFTDQGVSILIVITSHRV